MCSQKLLRGYVDDDLFFLLFSCFLVLDIMYFGPFCNAFALQPKIRKNPILGFIPFQISNGVFPSNAFIRLRFRIKAAELVVSAQRFDGNADSNSMQCAISTNEQLARYAIPFCSGIYSTLNCLAMAFSSANFMKSCVTYSFSLSERRLTILKFVFLSTR